MVGLRFKPEALSVFVWHQAVMAQGLQLSSTVAWLHTLIEYMVFNAEHLFLLMYRHARHDQLKLGLRCVLFYI